MKEKRNKLLKRMVIITMAMLLTVCFNVKNMTVQAANMGYVENLTQTGIDKTSITLSWTPANNATSYQVFYRDIDKFSDSDYVLHGTASQTNYTISGLKTGEKYSVKVIPVNGGEVGTFYYDRIDAVTLLDKLEGLKQDRWYYFAKSLNVSWTRSNAAEGYEVVLYDNRNKKVSAKNLSQYSSSEFFSKMKDKVYTVKARSYMNFNGQKYYSSWSSIKCLNQARVKSIKVSGGKLNLKWGKVDGATGYRIYVSTKMKTGYKKVASPKKNSTSYSIKKLNGKKFNPKKTYYVYVETVCKGNSSGGLYYWNSKNGSYGYR